MTDQDCAKHGHHWVVTGRTKEGDVTKDCPTCGGTGKVLGGDSSEGSISGGVCGTCRGSGKVPD